jgi:hypothetical protein
MSAGSLVADTAKTWLPTKAPTRPFISITGAAAVGLAAVGVLVLATRGNEQYESRSRH